MTLRRCLALAAVMLACSCKSPRADPVALQASIDQALALRAQSKQAEGIAILERVRKAALSGGAPELATQALNRRGDLLHDLERDVEAAADYRQAITEAQGRGDDKAVGRAAHDLALLGAPDGDSPGSAESVRWYGVAIEARRRCADTAGLRVSANNLGALLFYLERWDESAASYQEAERAAVALGDREWAMKIRGNLALLHAIEGEGGFPGEDGVAQAGRVPDAERRAREEYAEGLAIATELGVPESDLCGVFGKYGARCERLSPRYSPEEGLLRFYEALLGQDEIGAGEGIPVEANVGLIGLRAADAARAMGPAGTELAAAWSRRALEQATLSLEALPDPADRERLCSDEQVAELFTRLLPSCALPAKPPQVAKRR